MRVGSHESARRIENSDTLQIIVDSPPRWESRWRIAMWFYICGENDKKGIVDSSKAENGYLYPRSLETGYGEKGPDKKICIAPTIGQCMVAKPIRDDAYGRYYIYRFEVKNPLMPPPDSGIRDIEWSDEHWITDEVIIDHNNGSIEIECIGHTEITPDIKNTLKRLFCSKLYPKGNPEKEKYFYKELAITTY
jgi:hypothetical protein